MVTPRTTTFLRLRSCRQRKPTIQPAPLLWVGIQEIVLLKPKQYQGMPACNGPANEDVRRKHHNGGVGGHCNPQSHVASSRRRQQRVTFRAKDMPKTSKAVSQGSLFEAGEGKGLDASLVYAARNGQVVRPSEEQDKLLLIHEAPEPPGLSSNA